MNGDDNLKQIIPFTKELELTSKVSDITSIALEHNLKMENNDSIVGEFIISGKYKINEISINEEVFEEKLDFDITLDDKYDASKVKIDIDDFYYDITDDGVLKVHIDVLIDNLVYIKETKPIITEEVIPEIFSLKELKENIIPLEERQNDMENDIKNENVVKQEEINMRNDENLIENLSTKFLSFEEKYSTYKVHIVRENDTLDEITKKYNVLKEELEKYNDLQNFMLGNKIIIPLKNE